MNKKGYCIGCLRNRAERQNWHRLSDDDKRKVLTLIARRTKRIQEHRASKRNGESMVIEQLGMFGELLQ